MPEKVGTAAEKKTTASRAKPQKVVEEVVEEVTEEVVEKEPEFNFDKRVTVKNLADWDVSFRYIHDAGGVEGILVVKNSSQRLSRNEVIAQVNSGNRLFTGVDGKGSHAELYIDDAATRRYVGFETDKQKQLIFTDEMVLNLFDMTFNEYKEKIPYYIKTRNEKALLIDAIKRLGLNDYRKIKFACDYTGINIDI